MKTQNIKLSDFPCGYAADEILAHAIVAHFTVNEWTAVPRREMLSHIWSKLRKSNKTYYKYKYVPVCYNDEHMALVEQVIHLDYENPLELLDAAMSEEERTLRFHYLLAFKLANSGLVEGQWVEMLRRNAKRLLSKVDIFGPSHTLGWLRVDCGLHSNMRWSGGTTNQMQAAMFGLLSAMDQYGGENVWRTTSDLSIPYGYEVTLTVSDDYDTTNIVVEVNGIPTLVMDLNTDYVLWDKDAGWSLLEVIQQNGGATMERAGRLQVA